MVNPSLAKLMEKENINRYTLVVATAKAARKITDEYIAEREYVEKSPAKDSAALVINAKYRDEKAVQNAVEELYDGEYTIVRDSLPFGQGSKAENTDENAGCEAENESEKSEDESADEGSEDNQDAE